MAFPEVDISTQFSVTNSTYNATNTYTYTVPPNKVLRLREFSLGVNGSFVTNTGYAQVSIANRIVTNAASVNPEAQLINTLTVRWDADDDVYLHENEQLIVRYRVTAGTGAVASVAMNGTLLSPEEYKTILKRKGYLE